MPASARPRRRPRGLPGRRRSEPTEKGLGFLLDGAKLVLVSRFMLAAAVVTLLVNWVNTNGENLLFRVVQEALASQAVEQGVTDPGRG